MKNEEKDLLARTKMFARRIIRLYCSLGRADTVSQVLGKPLALEANELVAIFVTIVKNARGHV